MVSTPGIKSTDVYARRLGCLRSPGGAERRSAACRTRCFRRPCPAKSTWRQVQCGPDGRVGSALVRGRDVAGRLLGVAAEQELLHLLLEKGAVLRLAGRQPVLVDQHGLVRQPGGPCGLADVGVDALAQFAGPGNEIQALGLALFVLAEDGAGHGRVASE